MYMPTLYFYVRAGYYRVVMHMFVLFGGITGHVVDMPSKIRVPGGCSGKIMKMPGCLAGSVLIAMRVEFVIHVMHPLLLIYAKATCLDIAEYKFAQVLLSDIGASFTYC
jgi:hypothetical protein